MIELEQVIEAIIFVSDEPVTVKDLLSLTERPEFQIWEINENVIENIFQQLLIKYSSSENNYGYELRKIANGYQFFTKTDVAPYVRIAIQSKDRKKMSKASLETLAIVAYRQPVTKAEIEYIRGVNSDYAIHKLLDKELIEPAGRSDLPGKPLLYKTTTQFLQYFGLDSLQDLPKLKEILSDEQIPAELLATEKSLQPVAEQQPS